MRWRARIIKIPWASLRLSVADGRKRYIQDGLPVFETDGINQNLDNIEIAEPPSNTPPGNNIDHENAVITNSRDRIAIYPQLAYPTLAKAESRWIGRTVIFDSIANDGVAEHPNNGFGEVVERPLWKFDNPANNRTNDGPGKIYGLAFANRFPVSLANARTNRTHYLYVAYRNTAQFDEGKTGGDVILGWQVAMPPLFEIVIDFDKEIENIVFETDINTGYSNATLTLNQNSKKIPNLYNEAVGRMLEIFDPYGSTVYQGIVHSVSLSGENAVVSSISFSDTFSWYYLRDFGWPEDTKITQAIREIVATNNYLNYYDMYSSIDPGIPDNIGDEYAIVRQMHTSTNPISYPILNNTQTAQYYPWSSFADAKIGAKEFNKADTTAKDALNEILSLGFYGTFKNTEGNKVALQIWNNGIPRLRIIPRQPKYEDINFLITKNNFAYGFEGLSMETNISDMDTLTYTTYNSSDGEQLRSASAFNYELFRRFGFKGEIYRSNGGLDGELANAATALTKDKSQISTSGSITLTGLLRGKRGHSSIPLWKLKAGDVIAFDFSLSNATNLYKNSQSSPGIFTVGSTSYNVASNTITITNHVPALWRDLFDAGIKD